jgi:hypothetical protein
MKVDLSKKYQTANGLQVELYKQHDIGAFPIVGAILKDNFWHPQSWSVTGNSGVNFNWNLEEAFEFRPSFFIERYSTLFDYFGIALSIPAGVKWLATDENGTVYGYFDEPYSRCKPCHDNSGFWDSDGDSVKIVKIKFAGDWRHSKIEVTKND